jgi:hypothetical protein
MRIWFCKLSVALGLLSLCGALLTGCDNPDANTPPVESSKEGDPTKPASLANPRSPESLQSGKTEGEAGK